MYIQKTIIVIAEGSIGMACSAKKYANKGGGGIQMITNTINRHPYITHMSSAAP